MIRALILMTFVCAGPALAQETSLTERLRALRAPAPTDFYEDDKRQDLSLIARHAPALFGDGGAVIAMFTGPECPDCARARAELEALARERGVTIRVLDIADPEHASLMTALSLDALPSYVMADRLIRGHMPAFVLARYLSK